jgi:hypothetical protein
MLNILLRSFFARDNTLLISPAQCAKARLAVFMASFLTQSMWISSRQHSNRRDVPRVPSCPLWLSPLILFRRYRQRFLPKGKGASQSSRLSFSLYFQNIKLALFTWPNSKLYFRPQISNIRKKPPEKGLDRFPTISMFPDELNHLSS